MAIYSGFSHKKIVIFHSYVKLPEGNLHHQMGMNMTDLQNLVLRKTARQHDLRSEMKHWLVVSCVFNHIWVNGPQ